MHMTKVKYMTFFSQKKHAPLFRHENTDRFCNKINKNPGLLKLYNPQRVQFGGIYAQTQEKYCIHIGKGNMTEM